MRGPLGRRRGRAGRRGTMPRSSSEGNRGALAARSGPGPALDQRRSRTIWRQQRRASSSSAARKSARPEVLACISAPPSSSSSASSPIAIFTSGGPPRKTLARSRDEHGVVAHARRVGPSSRRRAEDEADRRDAGGRQLGEPAERGAARHEDLRLSGEVGATGLGQADVGESVLLGDLEGAQALRHARRVGGTALEGRVAPGDDALGALDHTDHRHATGGEAVDRAVAGERGELEQRRVDVDEGLDPLSDEQLAAGPVAVGVALAAALEHRGDVGGDLVEERRRPLGVRREFGRARVEARGERGHGGQASKPSSFASTRSITSSAPPPIDMRRASLK